MSKDLNQVTLIGRLVKKPEIKYTTSGQAVSKFSMAVGESYMVNNEKKEITSFFDIVVWGNQAVNCEKYLNKGSQTAISGRLRQNRWTDQTTGKNLSKVEIIADSVQFLTTTPKPEGNNKPANNGSQNPWNENKDTGYEESFSAPFEPQDDIPF